MRFPMTDEFLAEAERYGLRSACCHCAHVARDGACGLGWPNQAQRRWPLQLPHGDRPAEVHFCKEFELA